MGKVILGFIILTLLLMPLITAECIDSDNGINYFVFGAISDTEISSLPLYPDLCTTDVYLPKIAITDAAGCYLRENYCESGQLKAILFKCPNGCSGGVCLQEENELTQKCANPDNLNHSLDVSEYNPQFPPLARLANEQDPMCLDSDKDDSYIQGLTYQKRQLEDFYAYYQQQDYCAKTDESGMVEMWTPIKECSGQFCYVFEWGCADSYAPEKDYVNQGNVIGAQAWRECAFGCKDGACNRPTIQSPIIENDIGSYSFYKSDISAGCSAFLNNKDCFTFRGIYNLKIQDNEAFVNVIIESYNKNLSVTEFTAFNAKQEASQVAQAALHKMSTDFTKNSEKGIYISKLTYNERTREYVSWISHNNYIIIDFQGADIEREDLIDAYLEKHPSDIAAKSFFSKIWSWFKNLFGR